MPTLRQENKQIYWAWKSMKQRCLNPNCSAYYNYGARGISVCDEWMTFEPFCDWALSNGYQRGLDLDRVDNDGNYEPSNCRWSSRRENVNNRRKTTFLTVNGETRPRTEWEDISGIPRGTVKGWVLHHGIDYAETRVKEAIEQGYLIGDYNRNHTSFPVLCIETGKRFQSIRNAAKHYGLNNGSLLLSIRRKGTCGGYHFTFLEDGANEQT